MTSSSNRSRRLVVECRYSRGSHLPPKLWARGYTEESEFNIRPNQQYSVHGICMWTEGVLMYLIDPDGTHRPNWYPAQLFEVRDNRLPDHWVFAFVSDAAEHGVSAVWGYQELVDDQKHFDGLLEREEAALRLFALRTGQSTTVDAG